MPIYKNLRLYIKSILIESIAEDDDLLLEPDLSTEDDRDQDGEEFPDEASTVASMGSGFGYSLPIGKSNADFSKKNKE